MPPAFGAEWRNPLLFSWPIDEAALESLVPEGLELDRWDGSAYISLVGLRIENPKLFGIPSPFGDYDELNLRFYVRRKTGNCGGRGVVFVRQVASHRITAVAARLGYGEPFVVGRVQHRFDNIDSDLSGRGRRVEYSWQQDAEACRMWAEAAIPGTLADPGSLAEFLTARHWGYNGKPGRRTRAYPLTRPEWTIAAASDWGIEIGDAKPDGKISDTMVKPPASVVLASGSHAEVGLPHGL